jgi:hypothetical protein
MNHAGGQGLGEPGARSVIQGRAVITMLLVPAI